ncbi:DsbA family protein [Gordonia sp. (in: high G+C Gram-positive bacteria)]|uniref:DsbA family protein n=1 Tax=Gordonia sp. (in: high G+C Gram-positive bacteria) TaxID=84139 RepID=UPI003F9515FC
MTEQHRPWWTSRIVPSTVIVIGVVAVAFVLLRPSGDDSSAGSTSETQSAESIRSEWEDRDPEDPMALGPADAPVGLVMFTDFQCPYCAQWSADTLPELLPYTTSGKLRIEFRDMNVYGDASERAARAAYAAALQGRMLDYHQALFAGGKPRPKSELDDDALIALADELHLDVPRLRTDYESRRVLSAVRNKASDGFTAGTYTTPAFVLGNEPILGAQPTKVFTDALHRALTATGN